MRVLLISNNFPPEVNALATRSHEHARRWVQAGGEVDVITAPPHFPEGEVYDGYENRRVCEEVDGVRVTRVPMYTAANEGFLHRTLDYASFMLSAAWHSGGVRRPDVVVASTPHFFAGLAGYLAARRLGVPFVLEVRDLWPESIVAVGALQRGWTIRALERVEAFLYRAADAVVVVSNAFRDHIEARGGDPDAIHYIPNGIEAASIEAAVAGVSADALRAEIGLEARFVASYIGTIGMAHRVDVLIEAARRCADSELAFLIVGTGAERDRVAAMQRRLQLPNLHILDKQPRERALALLAASDVSVVHLKDTPLFRTVIPSKIFEAMALGKPVALGVRGESRALVEGSGAGVGFEPENADALLEAVGHLKRDRRAYARMAHSGRTCVAADYDRTRLADRYWSILEAVARGKRTHRPGTGPRRGDPAIRRRSRTRGGRPGRLSQSLVSFSPPPLRPSSSDSLRQ